MNKPPQDYGIPMLTEVLETPAPAIEADDIPELTQVAQPAPYSAHAFTSETAASETVAHAAAKRFSSHAASTEIADALADQSAGTLSPAQDEDWALLQEQITERVLAKIMQRIDAQLELRVRDNLADVLQLAVHRLSEEIRTGLQHTLEDVIDDAVKHEINRARFSGK